jgi:integrase
MASAWIFQDDHQVKKHGADKASWYVGWMNPDGKRRSKSCGPGSFGKLRAEKPRRKVETELEGGQYREQLKKTWEEFRTEYKDKILSGLASKTRKEAIVSLNHFDRLLKPGRMVGIGTQRIDEFVAARRKEPGRKPGSMLSPASINKDLRHIKAALRVAQEWGYLHTVPKFRMEKEPKRLPSYVTGEHFAAIYQACGSAKFPRDLSYPAGDWWRGLIVMGYMTGWRISDMLGLRRDDLNLEAGTAVTRAEDNKGKRDELVKLHPVVTEHLKKLASFDPHVFPWDHDRRTLHTEFARIQEQAGIHLSCQGQHEHTRYCHVYGFHDLRRAFATMNADKLTPDALQALMRHKSYQTTQVYINMGRQMDAAVASLHVPAILKSVGTC